jgi:hypothetical protein
MILDERENMQPAHATAPSRVPRMSALRWPSTLWIVRHGESACNVARDEAHAKGAERIELTARDVDMMLSPRGGTQARALANGSLRGTLCTDLKSCSRRLTSVPKIPRSCFAKPEALPETTDLHR